ncbi:hypothetical protein FOZ62_004103 [Perkinsus olseni]|uniref:Uncharacterized protein n=1 Tax=Perkinsus olseni TaxID=32597 RepID=A0A7J6PT84_PEROL|nr:hypothetical protein FOZ62_004103 [Perkinsus olseni]
MQVMMKLFVLLFGIILAATMLEGCYKAAHDVEHHEQPKPEQHEQHAVHKEEKRVIEEGGGPHEEKRAKSPETS